MSKPSFSKRVTPTSIITGLIDLDHQTLVTLLAVFEDSSALPLISDKIGTFADATLNKYSDWKDGISSETQDRFSLRVQKTANIISGSGANDDCLRLCLWMHIRQAFELPPRLPISPRDMKNATNDIGAKIGLAIARKRMVEERASISKLDKTYWSDLVDDVNPFSNNDVSPVPFEDAFLETILSLCGVVIKDKETPGDKKTELLSKIKEGLEQLDKRILEDAGIKELTDETITKLLKTGGGLVGIMGAVEVAGFGAYIFAAQAAAIIPLVGGKTLITALFVLSHPLFVVPALFAAGTMGANSLTKSVRQAFAITVSSLLAVRGVECRKENRIVAAELFFNSSDWIIDIQYQKELSTPPDAITYEELGRSLTTNISLPPQLSISEETTKYLETPLDAGEGTEFIEGFLFPNDTQRTDAKVLGGMVLGDLLFDLSAIDPEVLKAADFSHRADLSGPFDFAAFAESIKDLPAASLKGHEANLMGYTAERIVAERLIENGHLVSIPDSATQPGFDLIIDGKEFQVKCLNEDNLAIIEQHFEKYPDTPVIANAEIANVISERAPDWANQVFFVEGYTYEFTNELSQSSLEAGAEIGDYELLPFIASLSAVRNAHGWWIGQQSLEETAFNVAVDTAGKGILAIAGGFMGNGLGLLVFGPAGAYIFGGVFAVAATTQSNRISEQVDTFLDPDRDSSLHQSSDKLLNTCRDRLEAKVLGIESKMADLPEGEVSEAMRHRWQWELVFVKGKINETNRLTRIDDCSGGRKAIAALELATQCGVHPVWLQEHYKELLCLLNAPIERPKKAKIKMEHLKETVLGLINKWRSHT
jgi:hypothetical protein